MATLAPSRAKIGGDLLADAAGGAGDDGDLVPEFHANLFVHLWIALYSGGAVWTPSAVVAAPRCRCPPLSRPLWALATAVKTTAQLYAVCEG